MDQENKKSEFVHLHNHTDYSLLDGAASISNYIAKVQKEGMSALAITDHGNMYGALNFYTACKKVGIKPIVGCEFYMNPKDRRDNVLNREENHQYHLILLAMNDAGYHRLMELNSIASLEGFYYKPRIDDEVLASHSDDLICLSACLGGEILQLILKGEVEKAKERALWFKSIFGDRYYIELQDHGLEEQKRTNPILIKIAKELDIPLVCTNDIHYIEKEDAGAQDILLCIGTGTKKSDEKRMRFPNDEFYFKTEEEMRDIFSSCPESLENTKKIADRCNLEIKLPGPLLPVYQIPKEFDDAKEFLTHLSYEGCKKRYGEITDKLKQRLDYELKIILDMDFQGYFLIVQDYIIWAKEHDIPVGPGRGSGAGSLVAYSLEITDVDPIKYNLLFERFLNPDRVSMPDFDIDFCFERRGEVIQYVTEHYGNDRVGQIITFGTLKTKAVVKDVARVLDIPFDVSNNIAKLIPDEPKMTVQKALDLEPKLKELEDSNDLYKELFAVARKLEGKSRHTSLHAAGVVIGKTPLIDYVPLVADIKTRAISTQYTMDVLENCGLVKMDFLGLKTLTLIKHTTDFIRKKNPSFDISKIDEEDKNTFDMLKKGDSACVFQFESGGMQRILRDAEPNNIEDLVALNALYRPGPMAYIPTYVNCKKGLTPIEYADPVLEPILKNTYGVIVYQEQVMQVAQTIGGYSLGQADILRRIMGKKKVDQLAAEKVKFIAGAIKKGHSEKHADDIFEMLAPFAQYGFNKSHAVAYSILAYQTAYLKANYPSEFLAANLTNEINNADKYKEYLTLADTMNIKLLPPDINLSEKNFNVVNNDIIYGLSGIKNIGDAVTDMIVRERKQNGPYLSFMDFIKRQKDGVLNTRLLEALIKSGTFDSLNEDRSMLLFNLEDIIAFDKAEKEATAYGQALLFDDDEMLSSYEMKKTSPLSEKEILDFEKEYLGFYASGHPLDRFKYDIERAVWVDISQKQSLTLKKTVNLICLINTVKVLKTKKGDKMCVITLSNFQGSIEAIAFSNNFIKFEDKIVADRIYGFRGVFDKNRNSDEIQFIIEEVMEAELLPTETVSKACLSFSSEVILKEDGDAKLQEVVNYLKTFEEEKNTYPIIAYIDKERSECSILSTMFTIPYTKHIKQELLSFEAIQDIWYQ